MAFTITRELARLVSPRFLSKIEKRPGDPCWHWTSTINRYGYGFFKLHVNGRGINVTAHRFSYVLHCGEIPDGLQVRHTCDVRDCVNPVHLLLGSHAENMADKVLRGRVFRPCCRLTSDDIKEIRRLVSQGMTQDAVGKQFGVAQGQISKIARRLAWAHVA